MSREIEFRVFHKCENKMLEVTKINFLSYCIWSDPEPAHLMNVCNDDCCVLMQYTGLKDKHGKKAFHKDICIGNWPYAKKCLIEWDDKRCGFYFKPLDGLMKAAYDKGYKLNANKFEIIGNIYENPDLLEQAK